MHDESYCAILDVIVYTFIKKYNEYNDVQCGSIVHEGQIITFYDVLYNTLNSVRNANTSQ